jgi:hypothetical protein
MRTTVNLADDVAAGGRAAARERSIGLSKAVNELVRSGLAQRGAPRSRFVQRTHELGLKIDVTDVAEALEQLEGPAWR